MTIEVRPALRYPDCVDFIDVSACQGSRIDWSAVKAAGFAAVSVKTTEGGRGIDPEALHNLVGARAVGLYTLAYHFARVTDDPDAQAQEMWNACGDTMPNAAVLDLEIAAGSMSPHALAVAGLKESDAIEQRFGRPPILYTGESFFIERIGPALAADAELADAYRRIPSWIARYASTSSPWVPPRGFRPKVPSTQAPAIAHQYSGNGGYRVPGIPGDCDRSLFFGDIVAFRRLLGLPDPDIEPTSTRVVHPIIDFPSYRDGDDDPPPRAA